MSFRIRGFMSLLNSPKKSRFIFSRDCLLVRPDLTEFILSATNCTPSLVDSDGMLSRPARSGAVANILSTRRLTSACADVSPKTL